MAISFFKRALASLIACSVALSGCGGGDGDDDDEQPTAITLQKTTYQPGELIDLSLAGAPVQSVELTLPGDSKAIPLQVIDDNKAVVPILPKQLSNTAGGLMVQNLEGKRFTADVNVTWATIATSEAGVATIVYLDATIRHLQRAYDELVTMAETEDVAQAKDFKRYLTAVQSLRDSIGRSMDGTPETFVNLSDGSSVKFDASTLEMLDQLSVALLKVYRPIPASQASGAWSRARALSFTIPTVNCAGLVEQSDRAFCANLQTQIASDLLIAYTGMAQTVFETGLAGAGLLSALGLLAVSSTTLAIAGIIGATAVIGANLIAGAMQGASVSGTGTQAGTNVSDNIKNINEAIVSQVGDFISRIVPASSELYKELNAAIAKFITANYWDDVAKLIQDKTVPIGNCQAFANAGERGTFVRRYDFGGKRRVVLNYQAFGIPDRFDLFDSTGTGFSTNAPVSGSGTLTLAARSNVVVVRVIAPEEGTAWEYSLGCQPAN